MRFLRDVRTLLGYRDFRRLFAVRLVSQLADGVFQVALASYVLFSPESQPTAGAVAAGVALLLLPFSLLGPFCGVLLDRWSRRQALLGSNVLRSALVLLLAACVVRGAHGALFVAFAALVLACLSVNRFLLAALSAALPRVVPAERLVLANAVAPTCGTLAYLTGLMLGSAVTALRPDTGAQTDALVLGLASVTYQASGLLALRMPRHLLGPDLGTARAAVREAAGNVLRGLLDGGRHVLSRRPACLGLTAVGVHRFGYGVMLVVAILLYRNDFDPERTRRPWPGSPPRWRRPVSGCGWAHS